MPQGIRSIPGDVNADDRVNAFDLVGMRSILTGSANGFDTLAADIDEDGEVQMNDAVQLAEFLSGKIKAFTVVERPQPPTQPPTEPPTTPPPSAENKWDTYQETASSQNIDFYKSAIKHMGNTYRLDKKLEGAENGDPVQLSMIVDTYP
ncbi:MAG TPA: dockerin type I repeat-containing protein, partial [Ruminococcus flavefaciens]|nr:dockerin type I repeat-containing protein [Ruminococcus flavefaciens]